MFKKLIRSLPTFVKTWQKRPKQFAGRDIDGLTITRLRLLSDPGFPFWDVSYCYGELDGKPVRVQLPFSQLPKKNMNAALHAEAKATGKFIKGLFGALSTLN